MSLPTKIAVLIPEFPGQTHSFFWREIEALKSGHGILSQIISTRLAPKPVFHDWVEEAAAIQLYPLPKAELARLMPDLALALPRLAADSDIRRILHRPKTWAFVIMALQLARICKAQGLSHLHVHSCANFALIAALCHRISGIPYSLVLHGPFKDYGPDQPVKWKEAAFVFVITETLRAEVAQLMPNMLDKVRVVPMGVNTDLFRPPAVPRPDNPDPFTWFSCGRLNRVKGYDILIEAASILHQRYKEQDFRIRIAGEDDHGGTGYRREVEAALARSDVSDRIVLLGSIDQTLLRQELETADAFVLPSRNEALGVAYMEAMACELSVIGTDAGGVKELINHESNGLLVPPEDARSLADAMERTMRDPGLRRSLGIAARERVLADFSSRRSADALAAALKGNRP
ncbi:exopolysaccharide biosynthesis GT4 family glycosyltransferase EpsE [Paracoccus sp. WLY502]|uniref:exopolysaccharide biosynthesis GT4 family glycosyltransferase EpsE n=1 Tax=Paracoccus yibinensis TaxID=3068891 RepID=UPI0027967CF2|nr:exopolysaccharide biosynthesis GT4 family glycosyltransferase EpsE [Paracoccus sp. WLY502]MDQ1902468.1 exopolysaccharide biosynthesis GT4 family glycosyltransferase EpsE [Paracoccus sp. WLY502]